MVGRIPIITMCAPTVRERSSAWLRLPRTDSSSSAKTVVGELARRDVDLDVELPELGLEVGSAIASSTAALASAGRPSSSVRLSSISRPNEPRVASKRSSASMRAKTSRQVRTFSR